MNERDMFLEALEIDDIGARAVWLDDACAGDAPLRSRLDQLLAAMPQTAGFLETPPPELAGDESGDEEEFLSLLEPADEDDCLGRLGPYHVDRIVGRGGTSIVFQGRDPRLNRVVAIKVMSPEFSASRSARQRFLREAQAAAAVRHENLVTLFAVEEEQQLPYLVMDFVEGQSLQGRLDREGPLPLDEALRIGAEVASGLAAAHRQGLVHRDIKPANILLEAGGSRAMITDFGLARAAHDLSITQTGLLAGTPQYMSPEQAQGKPIDHRSDLFSLGCVMYAMCVGRPPFAGNSALAVLRSVCQDHTPRIPGVPHSLANLIRALLAKSPNERPATAEEVVSSLESELATLRQRVVFPQRRRAWLAAAAVLALCGAGLGFTRLMPTVLRFVTGEGTLVVQVDDPSIKVALDGEELAITGAGMHEIRLKPGPHRVDKQRDGRHLGSEVVTIAHGGRQVVRVSLELATEKSPGGRPVEATVTANDAKTEQLQQAESEWRERLRLAPDATHLHFGLAQVLQVQKRFEEAEAEYRAALEGRPAADSTRCYLASLLQSQNKWSEAEAELREYLRGRPDDTVVLHNLAVNLGAQGKLTEAAELYEQILSRNSEDRSARLSLGQLLRKRGELERSEAEIRQVLTRKPDDLGALYGLALTLETAHKWAEAEVAYREHLRIAPNQAMRSRLAGVLQRQGKREEADALLSEDATSLAKPSTPPQ